MKTTSFLSSKRNGLFSIKFLFTSLTALLLVITATFISILFYRNGNNTVHRVSHRLLGQVESYISDNLTKQLFAAENILATSPQELNSLTAIADHKRDARIMDHMSGELQKYASISAFYYVAAKTGKFYRIRRPYPNITAPESAATKELPTSIQNAKIYRDVIIKEIITIMPDHYSMKREYVSLSGYYELETASYPLTKLLDQRDSLWYKKALTNHQVDWRTRIDWKRGIDANLGNSGISIVLSIPSQQAGASPLGVAGIDINFDEISDLLKEEADNFHSSAELKKATEVHSLTPSSISAPIYTTPGFALNDVYIFLSDDYKLLASSDPLTAPVYTEVEFSFYDITLSPNNLITHSYQSYFDEATPHIETASTSSSTSSTFRRFISSLPYLSNMLGNSNGLVIGENSSKISHFSHDGNKYMTSYLALPVPTPLKIGVIASHQVFTGNTSYTLMIAIVLCVLMLMLLILLDYRLLSMVTAPLQHLASDMEKVRHFEITTATSNSKANVKRNYLKEIDAMTNAYENMKNGLLSFKKFVPSDVVAQLVKEGKEAGIGGEERELTLFFSDIINFSIISELTPTMEMLAQLRQYLNLFSNIIEKNDGTLDKYMGDSIMAFWGASQKPSSIAAITEDGTVYYDDNADNFATKACLAALHCQEKAKAMNEQFVKADLQPLETRFGIHTGKAIVGNIGSSARLNYTAIGNNVNLASRLEGINKLYNTKILISEDTYRQAKETIFCRLIDRVTIYKKQMAQGIYELVGQKTKISEEDHNFYAMFNKGMKLYFKKEWESAAKIFYYCLKQRSADGPSQVLIKRCLHYKNSPPSKNWNGVYSIAAKI